MAIGIEIHTASPISPAKATAITPRTSALSPSPYMPATAATSTTPSINTTADPPPPQPQQQPSGLPTPTIPSSFSTASPPPTQTQHAPPPPQPFALPTPFIPKSRTPSPRREIPPPPKVGEKPKPAAYYSPTPTPTYFQSSQPFSPHTGLSSPMAPRTAGLPPRSVTSVSHNGLLSPQSARLPYNSPLPTPTNTTTAAGDDISTARPSLEHPPGYVQNPYASDMTPEQRFATEQQNGAGSPRLGYVNGGSTARSPGFVMGGLGSPKGSILDGNGGVEESIWGVMGGWVKGVGKKMGEVEEEVWKRINGD